MLIRLREGLRLQSYTSDVATWECVRGVAGYEFSRPLLRCEIEALKHRGGQVLPGPSSSGSGGRSGFFDTSPSSGLNLFLTLCSQR